MSKKQTAFSFNHVFAVECDAIAKRLDKRVSPGRIPEDEDKVLGLREASRTKATDDDTEVQHGLMGRATYAVARWFRPSVQHWHATPSTELGLTGLALSGGGIRSATVCLGVLQSLARAGVLRHIDYLSTVSGGGFIGSALSSLLASGPAGTSPDDFPFRHEQGKREPETFRHLRAAGNYLAPGGAADTFRIPALLLRGVIVNFLAILPFLMAAAAITSLTHRNLMQAYDGGMPTEFLRLTPVVASAFLVWVVLYAVVSWLASTRIVFAKLRARWSVRNFYELTFSWFLILTLTVLALEALPAAIAWWWWRASTEPPIASFTGIVGAIAALQAAFVHAGNGGKKRWVGKVALYGIAIIGPLFLIGIYAEFVGALVYNDQVFELISASLPGVTFMAAGLWVFAQLIDPNSTSLHGFYRDRLSAAYLMRQRNDGSVDPAGGDRLQLGQLGDSSPYHLINGTINLQASQDRALLGREADFFLFSKHFVGSRSTGYAETEAIERLEPRLNLGTAMAISGAAAAPNMGTSTFKPMVFLLTLLNVRLGFWLPNPALTRHWAGGFIPRPGPVLLLKELFSKMTARSTYVNISDGGHIENLGVYELLRRRCKCIIVVDAERDEELRCGGLATVIRYAQIDMGIKITIDLSPIQCRGRKRRGGRPASERHWAVGLIEYGEDEKGDQQIGHLLYIKSSLAGHENVYVTAYADGHQEFPHESTADQFFDEEQFEAYRALGRHMGDEATEGYESETPCGLIEWLRERELGAERS